VLKYAGIEFQEKRYALKQSAGGGCGSQGRRRCAARLRARAAAAEPLRPRRCGRAVAATAGAEHARPRTGVPMR
jgi:hypothetical protein